MVRRTIEQTSKFKAEKTQFMCGKVTTRETVSGRNSLKVRPVQSAHLIFLSPSLSLVFFYFPHFLAA